MRGSRRLRLLLVLVVLTSLTLVTLDYRGGQSGPLSSLRRGSDAVFGPAQRAVGGAARSVGGALGGLTNLGGFSDDNARLQRENDELRRMLLETDDLRRQRDEWNALLQLKDYGTYTIVPAQLSAIGSAMGFEYTATIDVGSNDGVKVDQTVVSGKGLVGRTKRVGPYTSLVVLIADPGFTVGARLQKSAALGTAEGRGLGGMLYELFDQSAQITPGDVLVSTGSTTFVPGVPVGRITKVRSTSALTRTADVEPFVDVGSLDLVGVVVEPPRSTPRLPVPPSPVPQPPRPVPAQPTPSRPAPTASATPSG